MIIYFLYYCILFQKTKVENDFSEDDVQKAAAAKLKEAAQKKKTNTVKRLQRGSISPVKFQN